ncbi:MAG: flagellar basal body-associated FliL family protein [Tissierellia bacterium]|nr:flagellar basal body-associated FliL family protein [Tissierellia bacterium]
MSSRNIILIVILVLVIILAIVGVVLGFIFYRNRGLQSEVKLVDTYSLTLDDMYCNIKDSKRIMKVKITIETNDKKTLELLEEKQFLIRDDINKIVRNKTEEDLEGSQGQMKLQKEIYDSLVKIFNTNTITNVYFNDLIIQ